MPGDPLKRVTAGQPLNIPASTWNGLVDLLMKDRANQNGQGARRMPSRLQAGQILIQNSSGSDLDRFAVVGLDVPVILPSDNANEFAATPAMEGVVPTIEHMLNGTFAVLLQPTADEAVGVAMVSGVLPCELTINHADDRFADVIQDETILQSGPFGTGRILWKEAGTGTGKRAIVEFGRPVEMMTAVIAGAVQDSSNYRWTYTFKRAGNKSATGWNGWTAAGSAQTLTGFNIREYVNDSGPPTAYGNGVLSSDVVTDDGDYIHAVRTGTFVRVWPVPVENEATEYWFEVMNALHIQCPVEEEP